MHPFHKDVSSYFDVPTRKDSMSEPSMTPVSPSAILPRRPPLRPPVIIHTDWQRAPGHEAINETIHVPGAKGDTPVLDWQQDSNPLRLDESDLKTASKGNRKGRTEGTTESHTGTPVRPPSVKPDKVSPSALPTPSREGRPGTPRRPKVGREWSRSTSGSIWIHSKKPSLNTEDRRPSTVSNDSTATPGSAHFTLRSDRTPSRSPKAKPHSILGGSDSTSIKVEASLAELCQKTGKTDSSEETPAEVSSRTSSINPRRLISAPLLIIRRASLTKPSNDTGITPPAPVLPKPRAVRLTNHPTKLKRNHTAEALQRVTAILQDTKSDHPNPQGLLPPAPSIRPSSVRSPSERPPTPNERKHVHVAQGIVSQLTFYQRKSVEQFPEFDSPTSSQLSLRLGPEPANTPEERATYKVKRSPSAETEEFLKVDISIRGGTSYLASEARRIHTPPIPEAGADGRWRGFFFDYNAPSVEGSGPCSPDVSTGSISSGGAGEDESRLPFFKDLGRTKSKRCKRVVSGDWYDVKLRQLDAELEPAEIDRQSKCGERRLNSHSLLEKAPLMRAREQFDLTIPEHLLSSPLCPRHPRYWRVVKGKGSQFRGC